MLIDYLVIKKGGEKILLHYTNVSKLYRGLTNRQIEKPALAELLKNIDNHVEDYVKELAFESLKQQNKINLKREQQGEYKKSRIDNECIQNTCVNINQKHPSILDKTEDKTKEQKKIEKYNEMLNFLKQIE